MDTTSIIALLLHGNQLKRTPRTGWIQRGIVHAESVADHSYGVTFTALVLAEIIGEKVDLGKILAMATLHDLPEGQTTDIPAPAWRFMPSGSKHGVEQEALNVILEGITVGPRLMSLWQELHAASSNEARLVYDADKLDMFLQATVYQRQTGNRQIAEFWQNPPTFYFAQAQAIYDELRAGRDEASQDVAGPDVTGT